MLRLKSFEPHSTCHARAVSCGIDAEPLESWDGKGVISGDSQEVRALLGALQQLRVTGGCRALTTSFLSLVGV